MKQKNKKPSEKTPAYKSCQDLLQVTLEHTKITKPQTKDSGRYQHSMSWKRVRYLPLVHWIQATEYVCNREDLLKTSSPLLTSKNNSNSYLRSPVSASCLLFFPIFPLVQKFFINVPIYTDTANTPIIRRIPFEEFQSQLLTSPRYIHILNTKESFASRPKREQVPGM